MRREAQNILLVLLGGALLETALNGTYLRYVKPAQQPWLIIAGATMVALAVLAIAKDIARGRPSSSGEDTAVTDAGAQEAPAMGLTSAVRDDHRADEEAMNGHGHHTRSTWMLILPVLAIFLIAPPALGADAVNRSNGRTVASGQNQPAITKTNFPPLPAGPVVPMSVSEFMTRASWDATNSLHGRTIRLSGFIVRNQAGVYLVRLAINCCAADAFPVKTKLNGANLSALKTDEWIETTGTVQPGSATVSNGYTPTLAISTLRPVSAPADPYE
jgi:uncharacterized repeat protein (TIGR03943 family)